MHVQYIAAKNINDDKTLQKGFRKGLFETRPMDIQNMIKWTLTDHTYNVMLLERHSPISNTSLHHMYHVCMYVCILYVLIHMYICTYLPAVLRAYSFAKEDFFFFLDFSKYRYPTPM